jgi:hypothetical protein
LWWRTRNHQSSKFFPNAQSTAFLKGLRLDKVVNLTTQKNKLYNRIRIAESARCELRKKYITKNLKEVCQLASNKMIQSHSSLNVDFEIFVVSY